jgi:hypothetical protein
LLSSTSTFSSKSSTTRTSGICTRLEDGRRPYVEQTINFNQFRIILIGSHGK